MPKKKSKAVSKEDLLNKVQSMNALFADDDEELEESTEKNKQPSKESNEKKGPSKKTNTKKNLEALFADDDDDDDNNQEENKEKIETVENEQPEIQTQVNSQISPKKESNKDKKEDKKIEEKENENELNPQKKNKPLDNIFQEIDEEMEQEEEIKKEKTSERKNNGRIAFFHDDDEDIDEEKNIDKEKNSLENKEPLNIFSESIDDENLDDVEKNTNKFFKDDDEIEEEKDQPSKSELSPEKKERANKIKELLGDDEEVKEESKLDQNMKKLNAIFSEGEDPKEMEDDLNFIRDKYINKPDDFETKIGNTYLSVSDKIDDIEAVEEQKNKEAEEKEKKEIEENQEKKPEEKEEGKEQESKKEETVAQESSEKENDGPSVPQQSFKSMVSDFNKEHGTKFSANNIDKYLKGKFDKCEGETKAEQQKNFEKELHTFCNKAYANMLEKKGLQGKELTSGAFDNFNNFAKSLQQHCKEKGLLSKDFQIKEFGGMTPKEVKDIQLSHVEKLPQNQQQRTSKILAAGRKNDIKSMKNDLNESIKKVPNNGDGNGLDNINTKNALMSLRAAQHVHNGRSRAYKFFHPINNRRENNMIKDAMKQLTDKGYTIQDINQQLGKISGKDDLISQSVNEQKKTIDEMFERNSAKFEKQKEREAKTEEKKHGERISVPEADIAKAELNSGEKSKKIEPTLEVSKSKDGPSNTK